MLCLLIMYFLVLMSYFRTELSEIMAARAIATSVMQIQCGLKDRNVGIYGTPDHENGRCSFAIQTTNRACLKTVISKLEKILYVAHT